MSMYNQGPYDRDFNNEGAYMQRLLSSVWPEWKIIKRLGRGTYGAVYEIMRDDLGSSYKCALKVLQMTVSTPGAYAPNPEPGFQGQLTAEFGFAPGNIRTGRIFPETFSDSDSLEEFVRNVSTEIDLMIQLKGAPGIVSIEDYAVLRERDRCTILIRMEELEGLRHFLDRTGTVSRELVIRLGMDICTALSFCERSNILHRDIKPGNIFYSDKSGFKLGDFGISRRMESMHEKMLMTGTGTPMYMAPEIYHGERYNNTVDIYSLGLVLYNLLNGGLPPFYDTAGGQGRGGGSTERHYANMRRLKGEPLPLPAFADPELGAVICKACAPQSEGRFATAGEFRQALQNCLSGTNSGPVGPGGGGRGGSASKIMIPAAAVLVVCALFIAFILYRKTLPGREPSPAESPAEVSYTVIYQDAGTGEELAESETGEGVPGEQMTLNAPQLEGYTPVNSTLSLTLSETEENVCVFEYEQTPVTAEVSYTVIYQDAETGEELAERETGTGVSGEQLTLNAPQIEGCTPVNSTLTLTLSETEENVCVFEYKQAPVSVVYNTKGRIRILCRKYEKEDVQRLADSFTRESGIQVTAEVVGSGSYPARLEEKVNRSSDAPTLFMLSGFKDYEKYEDCCLELTDSAAAGEVSDSSLMLRGRDGKVYGLPCLVESIGLTVNTRLLEKAGYQLSDLNSFEDLERIVKDITSRKGELGFAAFTSPSVGSGVSGSYRFSEHASAVPLFYEVKDQNFTVGRDLSGTYMDQFRNYIDLYVNNSVVPRKEAEGHTVEDARQEFLQGKAVFHQDGSWSLEDLKDLLQGDAAVIPLYMGMPEDENQGLNKTCAHFWCVNSYAAADDREAAEQFLYWLVSSPEGIRIQTREMGFAIPYRKADVPDNIFLRTLKEDEETGKTSVVHYYKYGRYTSWIDGLDNTLVSYIAGSGSWDSVRAVFTSLW